MTQNKRIMKKQLLLNPLLRVFHTQRYNKEKPY